MSVTVTTRHLFTVPGFTRRPGFCRGGTRRFFDAHKLDWQDFVRHGIPDHKLEATGDAMALALVAWARKCEGADDWR